MDERGEMSLQGAVLTVGSRVVKPLIPRLRRRRGTFAPCAVHQSSQRGGVTDRSEHDGPRVGLEQDHPTSTEALNESLRGVSGEDVAEIDLRGVASEDPTVNQDSLGSQRDLVRTPTPRASRYDESGQYSSGEQRQRFVVMQQRPFRCDPHHQRLEENEQGRRRDESPGDGRHAYHERFAIFEA